MTSRFDSSSQRWFGQVVDETAPVLLALSVLAFVLALAFKQVRTRPAELVVGITILAMAVGGLRTYLRH